MNFETQRRSGAYEKHDTLKKRVISLVQTAATTNARQNEVPSSEAPKVTMGSLRLRTPMKRLLIERPDISQSSKVSSSMDHRELNDSPPALEKLSVHEQSQKPPATKDSSSLLVSNALAMYMAVRETGNRSTASSNASVNDETSQNPRDRNSKNSGETGTLTRETPLTDTVSSTLLTESSFSSMNISSPLLSSSVRPILPGGKLQRPDARAPVAATAPTPAPSLNVNDPHLISLLLRGNSLPANNSLSGISVAANRSLNESTQRLQASALLKARVSQREQEILQQHLIQQATASQSQQLAALLKANQVRALRAQLERETLTAAATAAAAAPGPSCHQQLGSLLASQLATSQAHQYLFQPAHQQGNVSPSAALLGLLDTGNAARRTTTSSAAHALAASMRKDHFNSHHHHPTVIRRPANADEIPSFETFPMKLHRLLRELAVQPGGKTIASFHIGGKSFAIHNTHSFAEQVMPLYFPGMSSFASFQRQLNLYDYQRIKSGPNKGAYRHDLFSRDNPELCRQMVRVKVKGSKRASSSGNASD